MSQAPEKAKPGRKPLGQPPKPPELRRMSICLRLLPEITAKAKRLGRARLEELIRKAKED